MAVVGADQLSFVFLVGQYYLALKGRGLVLSAAELALIQTWEQSGAPPGVVCAGIREAFTSYHRRHGATPRRPASLAYCRKAVARALAVWQEGQVGGRREPS